MRCYAHDALPGSGVVVNEIDEIKSSVNIINVIDTFCLQYF